ncbi:MAG: hypothetical protein RIR94_829 [Bacteroidota bacterium]|jgi:hypothetical protein
MKTSKKQFDDLFKEKLKTIKFEPSVAAQEALLQALKRNKTHLIKKTWGKLSIVLILVSTLVYLQRQQEQHAEETHYFQSQTSIDLLNTYPSNHFTRLLNLNQNKTQPEPIKPILAIVAQLQSNDQVKERELWDPLQIALNSQRPQLKTRTQQVAPPINDVFEFEGSALVDSKRSANQTLLCGQNQAQTKLIIAQSKIAKFSTDSIARDQETGVCRPVGFDENAVIQYTVFDKRNLFRRFQAENIHWGLVRTTKIAKPARTVEEVAKPKVKTNKTATTTTTTTTTHTNAQVSHANLHVHSTRQYIEPDYEEYSYNIKNDSLIFISDRVNFVVMMDAQGTILSKAEIEITEPYVYYLGEKRTYFDQSTGKVYICVATLYHFNFYELEPANGKTTYLFHLDDVWPNPEFQIENGKLSYLRNSIVHQQLL